MLAPAYSLAGVPSYSECGGGIATPVADGLTLYTYDGVRIVARNLVTGDVEWRTGPIDPAGTTIVTGLAVAGGVLVIGGTSSCESQSDPSGFFTELNAGTGATLWHQDFDLPVDSFVVSGSSVVSSGDEASGNGIEVRALDTGALTWAHPGCGAFASGVFVAGDSVLTDCGALSLRGLGHLTWARPAGLTFDRADPTGTASPAVYATNAASHVVALNAATGAVLWTSPAAAGTVLAVGPSRLFTPCGGKGLCALNRTNGARLWRDPTAKVPTSVSLAADLVFDNQGTGAGAGIGSGILSASTGLGISTDTVALTASDATQVSDSHLIVETGRVIDVYELQA